MKQQDKRIEYERSVLYVRVSSPRQVIEGNGINSQDQRCQNYSTSLGAAVAAVFPDEGVSGGLLERPGFKKLLEFLDDYPNEKFYVIIDDLSRLARDVKVYLSLKQELTSRGAVLKSPNFDFEDTPEGDFLENIIAAKAQLDKQQNTRQVLQKMKARLELGYWPFCPPPGLKNVGGVLDSIQPYANIYKDAIEQYRDYKLNTLDAVRGFILSEYANYGIKKVLSLNGAQRILSNILYAGYLEYQPWGVPLKKAQHKGFISYDTYLAVQEKLESKAKPRHRKDYNADFPVRGYALCHECIRPMTGAWFKGNGGRFAYYYCKTLGCSRRYKSVPKKELEESLEYLLKQVRPDSEFITYIEEVLKDVWKDRSSQEQKVKAGIKKLVVDLEQKNKTLMERISQSRNQAVIMEYEKVIERNLGDIKNLQAKLEKVKYPQGEFQTALGVVLEYVQHPVKQWQSGDYRRQRLLLAMYFEQKLIYSSETKFQTVQLPLILELSKQKMTPKGHLVENPERC